MLYGLDIHSEKGLVLVADSFGYLYMYVCINIWMVEFRDLVGHGGKPYVLVFVFFVEYSNS